MKQVNNKPAGPLGRMVTWSALGATPIDVMKLAAVGAFRNRLFGGIGGRLVRGANWFGLRPTGGRKALLDLSQPHQIAVFEEIFLDRVYELDLVRFEPDLVIDCGAHVGFFTLLAACRFPGARVMAFEPQPDNWRQAREQLERNGIGAEISNAAVGIEDGHAVLVGGGCGGRLVADGAEGVGVDVVSLPRILRERAPKRLLLKMDIEGGEATLIPALAPLLPPHSVIFFETHGGTGVWEGCRKCLEPAGFDVRAVRRRADAGIEDAYVDAVACRAGGSGR